MADRILPVVRKLIVCNEATYSMVDEAGQIWRWQLTDVLSVVKYPAGVTGDFDVERLWMYAQFAGAVGEFDVTVRMQRVRLHDGKEVVDQPIKETSDTITVDFFDYPKLESRDFAFEWIMLPIDEPGVYRFSIWSNYVQLPGVTADLTVLDETSHL